MKRTFLGRLLATLIALLLLSAASISPATANQEQPAVNAEVFKSAYDAQGVQDILYVLLEDKLISITQGQEAPTTIVNLSEYPELHSFSTLLFSDDISLYALDTETQVVYQLNGSTLTQVVKLDVSEIGLALEDGSVNESFVDPFIQNGFLYVLGFDFADYSKKLYRFSLESGEGSQIPTNDHSFQEIIAYRDGQLLGLDFDTQKLVILDAITGKMIDEAGTLPSYASGAIAYDAVEDKIYSLCDVELLRWENKKPVTIGYVSAVSTSNILYVGIWKHQYTFIDSMGLYTCDTALGEAKTKPLTIWSEVQGLIDTEVLTDFMKLYPQTPVVIRGIHDEDPLERISTLNITGDASIDIFAVTSQSIDIKEIFKRGYTDALDSTILKNDVLSMYPQIQDYLTQNGVLCGFPVALWARFWTVQPELLQEAQLGAIPKLLDDYYDMMLKWYEDNGNSVPVVSFSGNTSAQDEWLEASYILIYQYIYNNISNENPISFNTPTFRAALEKIAALSQWKGKDIARDYSAEVGKSIFDTHDMEPFVQNLNARSEGAQYILPPTLAQGIQPVLNGTLVYFIVNPHSQNKEEAIKFLEHFSQNMEAMLKYELHPDDNELVQRDNYEMTAQSYTKQIAAIKDRIAAIEDKEILLSVKEELAQEEAAFALEEKNRWVYSAQAIAEYRKLAPYIVIKHCNLIWDIMDKLDTETILTQYFEGHFTLDKTLSELDRKVSMMFLENQ